MSLPYSYIHNLLGKDNFYAPLQWILNQYVIEV